MRRVMVSYRVKPGRAEENEGLVGEVYDELRASDPAGLRYATFKLEDGVSFVHIAETADGQNPLPQLAAFKRFQAGIEERCEQQPVVTQLEPVGSFKLFDE